LLSRASAARTQGACAGAAQQERSAASYAPSADFSYDPPGRNHLFVPGPVNIADRVQRAMAVPSLNHRDPWFGPWLKKLQADTRMIYNTDQETGSDKITPFVFSATGTGGWESALQNTLNPGDKIVTFRYGMFSKLWVDMMEAFGLDVHVIDCPWGEGANEEKLAEFLKANKDTKAVAVVHNETATGITSDLPRIRETMDAAGSDALFLVDGVSSIGALPFKMDAWGVDVAVTGSQKALSLPTGLGLVAVSEKAMAASKKNTMKRMYFDWEWQSSTNKNGSTPYTPSLALLFGLRESLNMLAAEGMNNVVKRHKRLATGTRAAVEAWGLKLLCKEERWRSDSLSVIAVPPNIDSADIVTYAYAKHNLTLGVGLGQVAGKVFRIGHLGNNDSVMQLSAIAGAEMALMDAGYTNFTPGAGVGAAIKYFQETAQVIKSRDLA